MSTQPTSAVHRDPTSRGDGQESIDNYKKIALSATTVLVATAAITSLTYFSPILFAGMSATLAATALASSSVGIGIATTATVGAILLKKHKKEKEVNKPEVRGLESFMRPTTRHQEASFVAHHTPVLEESSPFAETYTGPKEEEPTPVAETPITETPTERAPEETI